MAEDYGVSLKITADTSDLEKVPATVEQTRKEIERPVEQTVVEKRVVEDGGRERPAPAELTETVKVVEKREPAAPVEHPAETVKVEQDPDPLKPKVEQPKPVKVTADTSAAEKSSASFFTSFSKGVSGIRAAISSVFAAFGMVTFVVGGLMALVAGYQKLRDMLTATSRAIAQMRWDGWVGGFNAAADALIGKHQKIIALLKEEQDVANKAASLRTMETSQTRSQEDQARQQVRQAALAGATDPRERQRLEDSFSAEDDRIARQRFEQDRRSRLRQLEDEESMYRSKENGARAQLPKIDEQISNQENVIDISRRSIERGGDREKNEKYIEEAKKRIAALKDEKKQTEELIETMRREAGYRAEQARIVEKSKAPVGNQSVREARARAQEETDRREQADFERQQSRTAEDAAFEDRMRAAQRRATAPGATETDRNAAENEQIELLRGREAEAKARLEAARKRLSDELKKPATERDETALTRAREDIREADSTALSSRRQREDIEQTVADRRAAASDDYFGRLAQQIDASRPKDRLTAMGLGSGIEVNREQRELANNVRDVVSICRDLLAATKDNKPVKSYAKYAP